MHFFWNFPTKQHFAWGHHSTNQAACRLAGPGNRPGRQMVCPQGETAEWSRMWMCPRNLTGSTLSTIQKRAIGNDIWIASLPLVSYVACIACIPGTKKGENFLSYLNRDPYISTQVTTKKQNVKHICLMNTQLRKTRELYLAYIYILNPVMKLFLTKYYKNSTVYVLSYSYDSFP